MASRRLMYLLALVVYEHLSLIESERRFFLLKSSSWNWHDIRVKLTYLLNKCLLWMRCIVVIYADLMTPADLVSLS